MKENVKNEFQECKGLVPCIEENSTCEDLGSKEDTKDKSVKIFNGSGQVLIGKIKMWKKSGFQQEKEKNIKKERKPEVEMKKMKKRKAGTEKDKY